MNIMVVEVIMTCTGGRDARREPQSDDCYTDHRQTICLEGTR